MTMREVKAPNFEAAGTEKSLFIAGGISNCPDWQFQFINLLKSTRLVVYNPRRSDFDVSKKEESVRQIEWEHHMLLASSAVSFWFPKETLCSITLFELGKMASKHGQIFVGVHPDYARKQDVEVQMRLMRPHVRVVYNIDDLATQVKDWWKP
jgi:hypothetical protein